MSVIAEGPDLPVESNSARNPYAALTRLTPNGYSSSFLGETLFFA
jgi:hypothetical protein